MQIEMAAIVFGTLITIAVIGWGLFFVKRHDLAECRSENKDVLDGWYKEINDRVKLDSRLYLETTKLSAAQANIESLKYELQQAVDALATETKAHSITKGLLTKARKQFTNLTETDAGTAAKKVG